jgi:exodeoxyribonuclease V gamma subunit
LALSAAWPDRPFEARTIGRAREGTSGMATSTESHLAPIGESAPAHLATIVDLYRRAMREPVPLYCKTSAAWAEASRARRGDPIGDASKQWTTDRFPRESTEEEHRLVYGTVKSFDEVRSEPPRIDEAWDLSEPTRFGRWSRRLWDGLLDHERLTNR